MAFNYAKEKREFDSEWEKLRSEYETAGMSPGEIEALHRFDWDWFCSRRRFINHTQNLPKERPSGEDSRENSRLIRKFTALSVNPEQTLCGSRYSWVEEIEDAVLWSKIRRLSQEDLELLTLLAMEGYTQTEVAQMRGCSQNAVSKKYIRIKKNLK